MLEIFVLARASVAAQYLWSLKRTAPN